MSKSNAHMYTLPKGRRKDGIALPPPHTDASLFTARISANEIEEPSTKGFNMADMPFE